MPSAKKFETVIKMTGLHARSAHKHMMQLPPHEQLLCNQQQCLHCEMQLPQEFRWLALNIDKKRQRVRC